MPRGATGYDTNLSDGGELAGRDLHLVEKHPAAFAADSSQSGITNGARLLKDLLEHEVFVATLLGHHRIPENMLHRPVDAVSLEVSHTHTVRRQDGDVAVIQEKDVASVVQDGGNIGRDEVFVPT